MATTATPENCDKRGAEAILYYNVGTLATPVWVEHVGIVGDLNMPETEDEDELSVRSTTREVKEYTSGETDLRINGTQIGDSEYEGWQFLNSMRKGGVPRDVMVLNGDLDTVGSYGWRGKMWNKDRTMNGPATGQLTYNFNLAPAACTDTPVRVVKVAVAGTPADFDPTAFTPAA